MVGCWENLTNRENRGDRKPSLSERPIVAVFPGQQRGGWAGAGQPGLGPDRPLSAGASRILSPQGPHVAPCSVTCPPWPSHVPWPQTGHAHLNPPPFEPLSSAVPFPELLSPPRWGWGLHKLLTPQMVLNLEPSPACLLTPHPPAPLLPLQADGGEGTPPPGPAVHVGG